MKKISYLLGFVAICSIACAERLATSLVDDVNTKTHEPYFFFDAGDYERSLFFSIHGGFSTRSPKWIYRIVVHGAGTEFPAERVSITNEVSAPAPKPIPLAGGSLTVDRKTRKVTISLKVRVGDAVEDFPGNGSYYLERSRFEKTPSQAPSRP